MIRIIFPNSPRGGRGFLVLLCIGAVLLSSGCGTYPNVPAASFDFTDSKAPHGRIVPEQAGSPAITIHFPFYAAPEALHHWREHFVRVHDHDGSKVLSYFDHDRMQQVWESVWAEMVTKSTYWVLEMHAVLTQEFPEHHIVLVPMTARLNDRREMVVEPAFTPPPSVIEVHFSTYLDFRRFYDPSNSLMWETYGKWMTPLVYFVVSGQPESDYRRIAAGSWKRVSPEGEVFHRFDQPSLMHAKHRYEPYAKAGWFETGFGLKQSPRPYANPNKYFYLPGVLEFNDNELRAYQLTPFQPIRAPSYGYWLYHAGVLEDMLRVHPPEAPSTVNRKYLKVLGLKADNITPELSSMLEQMRHIEATFLSEQDRNFADGTLYSEWGDSLRVMLLAEKMQKDSRTAASNAAFFTLLGSMAGTGLQTQGNFMQNPMALMQMSQSITTIAADHAQDQQTLGNVFQNHFQRISNTQKDFIALSGNTELTIRAGSLAEMRAQFVEYLQQLPGIAVVE